MFFSKWSFFQGIIILCFIFLTFIAEFVSNNISTLMSSSSVVSMLMVLTFILIVSSLISLFLIFQSKKSETFLVHPLWEKMTIIMAFLFILSIILFISASLFTSLNEMILSSRWILYIIIYYFLFLMNIFVLSLIHKLMKRKISSEKKIELSFIWTVLTLFLLIFFLPSL